MRKWYGLIVMIVVAVVIGLIASWTIRGVMSLAKLSVNGEDGEPDPQFAEIAEIVTRPPDAHAGEAPVVSADEDPSQNWVYETLTPVEQTAAELAAS